MAAALAGLSCASGANAGVRGGESDPGVDMILVDPDAMPAEPELAEDAPQIEDVSWSGAPVDLLKPTHQLFTDLRRQLIRYQNAWSSLPQVRVPLKGGPLTSGAENSRVHALRERLGLAPAGSFDDELSRKVAEFQRVHGLPVDGKAGADTVEALNRGALHYERKLLLNMERARRLPAPGAAKKYVLVDAGSARLWMYENGVPVDSMKVVVGKAVSPTPMMGALMRFANVNPYWNVPYDLVQSLIAPRVVSGGISYLTDRRYEALDSYEADAKVVDPASVDWVSVASGASEQRVRQLPGGANSMGAIKFMMPNEYGIYLHDTPSKSLFGEENRWMSNGCVRLEDAERFAKWVFGAVPRGTDPDREEYLELAEPMPVYITYLTAEGDASAGTLFRADPYGRDAKSLARFANEDSRMREARPVLSIDLEALAKAESKPKLVTKPKATEKKTGAKTRASTAAEKKPTLATAKAAYSERKPLEIDLDAGDGKKPSPAKKASAKSKAPAKP